MVKIIVGAEAEGGVIGNRCVHLIPWPPEIEKKNHQHGQNGTANTSGQDEQHNHHDQETDRYYLRHITTRRFTKSIVHHDHSCEMNSNVRMSLLDFIGQVSGKIDYFGRFFILIFTWQQNRFVNPGHIGRDQRPDA